MVKDQPPAHPPTRLPQAQKTKQSPAPMEGGSDINGVPHCVDCQTPMDEVTQLNEQGSLGWGYAGHAANRLYLLGLIREQGMSLRTAQLRAFCCPKCRRGEFRY